MENSANMNAIPQHSGAEQAHIQYIAIPADPAAMSMFVNFMASQNEFPDENSQRQRTKHRQNKRDRAIGKKLPFDIGNSA